MLLSKKWLIALSVLLGSNTSHATEVSYDVACRCFFVYAPIFETGRNLQNQPIFLYGQKRVAWTGGYAKALENNPEFKKVFKRDLAINKKRGIEIEKKLTNAIHGADITAYNAVMSMARQCDQQLSLPSNDIPSP